MELIQRITIDFTYQQPRMLDSINKAEREFTCYAYPKHAGRTGRHAFGIRYDDTESATASDIFIKKDVEADFVVDENSIETWDIVKGPSGS